jgi:hypothetical protein
MVIAIRCQYQLRILEARKLIFGFLVHKKATSVLLLHLSFDSPAVRDSSPTSREAGFTVSNFFQTLDGSFLFLF